jgi:hypothetical protein
MGELKKGDSASAETSVVEEVRSALRSGKSSSWVTAHLGTAFGDDSRDDGRLIAVAAQTCLELGRRKETRAWLDSFVVRASSVDTEDLIFTIEVACKAGQTQAVLSLCDELSRRPATPSPSLVHTASAMMTLALRLRSPNGHNGAWGLHKMLLKEVRKLAEVDPHSSTLKEVGTRASALLKTKPVQGRGRS